MDQPTVNPSPRARFKAVKHCVDQHRELIARQDFQIALDYSLQQMLWEMTGGAGPVQVIGNDAAAGFYRLQGASEFIRILKTLAESPVIVPTPDPGEISHTFK